MKPHGMKAVETKSCPACRDGITSARHTYSYRRIYCCEAIHQPLWDQQDKREREREERKAVAQ